MNGVTSKAAPGSEETLPHRVFIVEDHALMRRSLVEAIEREPDLTVCGEAEGAPQALNALESVQPDLVLTDLHLQSSCGLALIKTLRERRPEVPIVATTMFDVRHNAQRARAAGAAAFVAKQDGPARLIEVIRGTLEKCASSHNPGSSCGE